VIAREIERDVMTANGRVTNIVADIETPGGGSEEGLSFPPGCPKSRRPTY